MLATEIWMEHWSNHHHHIVITQVLCGGGLKFMPTGDCYFCLLGSDLSHQNISVWHRNEIATKQAFTLESHQQGCWNVNKG